MTTRVIALDLDGTLLTSKKTILPASLEALARAREAGYQVIVVTGRHHVAIHPFIRHWLSIHLQFVVMAPICMIITQKGFGRRSYAGRASGKPHCHARQTADPRPGICGRRDAL